MILIPRVKTPLIIEVVRDGVGVRVDLSECTREEILTYFAQLDIPSLRNWTYLLAGYAGRARLRIAELEREADDLRAHFPQA